MFEELEYTFIAADFGVKASGEITSELKENYELGKIATSADIYAEAAELVKSILQKNQRSIAFAENGPTVILMVGVNGSGKTTLLSSSFLFSVLYRRIGSPSS